MRLGAYTCALAEGSLAAEAYGVKQTEERHRHRYEFNEAYRTQLAEGGMVATGTHPDSNLVEIVEIPGHPWFVGAQFHPEYKSTVINPHPLFKAFVAATVAFEAEGQSKTETASKTRKQQG